MKLKSFWTKAVTIKGILKSFINWHETMVRFKQAKKKNWHLPCHIRSIQFQYIKPNYSFRLSPCLDIDIFSQSLCGVIWGRCNEKITQKIVSLEFPIRISNYFYMVVFMVKDRWNWPFEYSDILENLVLFVFYIPFLRNDKERMQNLKIIYLDMKSLSWLFVDK